jgi:hypothetical protein
MSIKLCICGHKAQFHEPTDVNNSGIRDGKCREPRGCNCLHGEYNY